MGRHPLKLAPIQLLNWLAYFSTTYLIIFVCFFFLLFFHVLILLPGLFLLLAPIPVLFPLSTFYLWSPMFNFGISSVLGNRDNPTKKTRSTTNDDCWYLPYNGPYEAPPRAATPQRRKQRDSWGDPIPSGLTNHNLDLSAVGGILDKRRLHQQHEPRDI